ncbi:hypothetical protein [Nocardia sp. AG03]|uniref:hypothetical protein n=1 Tax=Nocardia sp. AG03 TaxID=3025312 RepID=UPI0024183AE6|nr:hypothetical protein [Nocardia sp. AG03]
MTTLGTAEQKSLADGVDASRDFWTGTAAEAMRTKHEEVRTTTKTFITALQDGASAAKAGASTLESAKSAVVNAVRPAQANGYEVGDDGTTTISASAHQTLLPQLGASSYSTAAGALQVDADASTTAVKEALENVRAAARAVRGCRSSRRGRSSSTRTSTRPTGHRGHQTWSVPSGSINEGTSYRVRLVEMTEKEIYNNDGKSMIVWEPKYEIQEQKMVVPITGGQGYPVAMPPGEWRSASIDEVMTVQRNSPTTLNIPDPTQDIK